MEYEFVDKFIFSSVAVVLALKWGLSFWNNLHNPKAFGKLLLRVEDIKRLVNRDNRKDKAYFLVLLKIILIEIKLAESINKSSYIAFNSKLDLLLKFYKYNYKSS